ncbi:MAG: type II secretion system minor pseudopilin GspH [Woeseiaceae bacterium]|nr:type II secretion system minor pseudopilin GspH [Woeseiaceae bacterium]
MARRRLRGFTLIELLVAVIIVGIVVSVAVISLNLAGDDREMQTEARRLMSLLEIAQDDAMMQGREFGLEFMQRGYRFVEYDPVANQWAEPFGDEMLRFRELPEDVEFRLWIDDRPVELDFEPAVIETPDDDERQFGRETYAPHLLIYSSGDMTPFQLSIERDFDNAVIAMEGDLLGNVELLANDDFRRR